MTNKYSTSKKLALATALSAGIGAAGIGLHVKGNDITRLLNEQQGETTHDLVVQDRKNAREHIARINPGSYSLKDVGEVAFIYGSIGLCACMAGYARQIDRRLNDMEDN